MKEELATVPGIYGDLSISSSFILSADSSSSIVRYASQGWGEPLMQSGGTGHAPVREVRMRLAPLAIAVRDERAAPGTTICPSFATRCHHPADIVAALVVNNTEMTT